MKRLFVALAAVAMLLVVTETASARPRWGVSVGYGWGGPYYGVSYGTRVGNSGFLSVGVGSGYYGYPAYGYYGYPAYGYGYATPVYAAPVYYSTPYYYSPYYYSGPTFGVSYYSGGWGRRGWGWGY